MANFHLLRGRTSQIGSYYSITAVVRDRRPLLVQGNNANILRDELQRITQEGIADTLAWVAMPDHLHWLFQLRQGSLGRCLQRFKSRSARAINLDTARRGRFGRVVTTSIALEARKTCSHKRATWSQIRCGRAW